MTEEQLIAAAREAALKAYAPYSRFSVGCAIESVDGAVATGVNVENACYRLGVCAEQSALSAAHLAFGLANVSRIAVAGGDGSGASLTGDIICTPCGGCRQAIYEASCLSGRAVEIICSSGDGRDIARHSIASLIPHGFGPANLQDGGKGRSGCDADERQVLDMVKYWPGRPATVTWDDKTGWSVGTKPEHLPE